MIFGMTFAKHFRPYSEIFSFTLYFYLMIKAIRRIFAAVTVALLAFRAVGSFLSWIEHQDESVADTWIDEDEFEDA